MRPLAWLASSAVLASIACGTASTPAGSGGGGPPSVDAGVPPAVDAGTGGGGSVDAGPANAGGGADAGGSPVGPGDAGTGNPVDGGVIGVDDCKGLAPANLPRMVRYDGAYSSQGGFCGLPIGDGQGVIALNVSSSSRQEFDFVAPDGSRRGLGGLDSGTFYPQAAGFIGHGGSSTDETVVVTAVDENGRPRASTNVQGSGTYTPDPNGGLLLAGHFGFPPDPIPANQLVILFNADASIRYGPIPVATQGTIFGAGVDLLGRAIVIVDGTRTFGRGSIAAQWFSARGAPLTGVFQVLSGFRPGHSTWFEMSPLIGGGLAMRRMDGGIELHTSEWLAVLPSGEARVEDAPDWLRARPNTKLVLVRGGRAYALVPWAADLASCTQQAEVVSPSGRSCARFDFTVDAASCQTHPLRIGLDGTVMQMLPDSRESDITVTARTCTLRFWPGALR